MKIGCHLSISKGYENMGEEILSLGGDVFQFFSRNPRGGKARDIDEEDIKRLIELMDKNKFGKILAHAPYTLNACSDKERVIEFAYMVFREDLKRMEYLPNNLYNFHPGSHVGQGAEKGIKLISELLNSVLTEEQTTIVLLETMAGKGTEIGKSFEELKEIIDGVELKNKIGVCLDTCHIYDGGYDIVNDLDGVIESFDSIIGLDKLHAIHLNDSKNPIGSHKDRHEKIGEGTLGIEAIARIINHKDLRKLPFYLETPNELSGYKKEINLLKDLYK